MHTRFKRFLLIFMMLALPVQAFASVTMLGCELSRARTEAQASPDSMGMAMAGCHQAPAEQPDTPAGEHRCSHCAACHLAAAFPIPASKAVFVAPVAHKPQLQPDLLFSGFIPEGPERPPRTSHA